MTKESEFPSKDSTPPRAEVAKIPVWVIGLVAANVAALVGPIVALGAWKGSIETEQRLSREANAREIAALRESVATSFASIQRRLEANDTLSNQVSALAEQGRAAQSRLDDISARLRAIEEQRRAP